MTDDELRAIEARAARGVGDERDSHSDCWAADADRDALVAEVRRLKAKNAALKRGHDASCCCPGCRRDASELASERAKSAGLQKRCEQLKADAFDGFDRLAKERDEALRELRRLQAKALPPAPVAPNVPSDGEVN